MSGPADARASEGTTGPTDGHSARSTLERDAIHGLKWLGFAKLASQLASWAVTLLVIRLLSPEDYGLMALTSVVITLSSLVAEMSMGQSIVQSRSLALAELERVSGFIIVLNMALGAAVFCIAPWVAAGFEEPKLDVLIQVMALQFLMAAVGTVPQALLSREFRFKAIALIDVAAALAANACTLVLAWRGYGVWALVVGALAMSAVRNGLSLWVAPRTRPRFSWRAGGIGSHLHYGGSMTLARLLSDIVHQTDMIVAGRFLAAEGAGLYSVAFHLATLPMQKISAVVNQVAFPTMARLQETRTRLHDAVLRACRLLTTITVPVLWGLSCCSQEFVALVLGERWAAAALPLQIICLMVPAKMVGNLLWTTVSAVGRHQDFLRNVALSAVIVPTALLIGVRWGVTGLALAWAIGWMLSLVVNLPTLGDRLGIGAREIVREVRPALISGTVMYATVVSLRASMPDADSLLRLGAMIVSGALAYTCTLCIVGRPIVDEFVSLARRRSD